MTHAYFTFGHFAVGHLPGWHFPGAGGYLLYRGQGLPAPATIDWTRPVGIAAAGQTTVRTDGGLAHTDGRWSYGLRAVSDAGVEEAGTAAVVALTIDGGLLVGVAPVGLSGGRVRPLAGGYLCVELYYTAEPDEVGPQTVELARRPAAGTTADIDWPGYLATWPATGGHQTFRATIGPFADGETVWLAGRTARTGGAASPVLLLAPAVADAVAPDPVTSVSAEVLSA